MSKRRSDDSTPAFAFDAETGEVSRFDPLSAFGATLPTDAVPPPAPGALSPNTRTLVADPDEPAPTVMAAGIGDVKMGQAFLDAPKSSGARRLGIDVDGPRETVMAGGVGDVNTGQYTLVERAAASSASGKPPYRVPLMAEVRALPWNGLTVVSTFSGCGGSCLGFKMAGYRVLWASEFVPAAQDTYRANHAGTHLDTSDIRKVTAKTIRAVIGDVEVDVLEGSPPCASFSTAGKTSRGWKEVRKYSDVEQRTDDLFGEYVRLVDDLRPRAFVAENVAGMVKGVAKGQFEKYLKQFMGLPYNVEAMLLDAQHLGVPQRRVRLIFVGVRKDVGKPAWPRKLPYTYSVRDAIPWIVRQGDNGGFGAGGMQEATEPSPTIGASDQTGNGRFPASLVEATLVGGNGAVGSAKGAALSLDEPLPTVLSGGHGPHGMRDRTDQFLISAPRVVYDEGFKATPPRDVTDEPCPTVKVGVNALSSTHFLVEGAGAGEGDTAVNRKQRPVEPDGGNYKVHPKAQHVDPDDVVPTVRTHNRGFSQLVIEPETRLGDYVGAEWDKMQPGESSARFGSIVKAPLDKPGQTITGCGFWQTHPVERRKFSIAELRRICGFPDDFILTGSYSQQWERLGRAVPPPMMRAVAEALLPVLKKDKP